MQSRLLFVDDETDATAPFARVLERAAYSVDCVDCGAAALRATATSKYDLLLLDLKLPDISGLELLGHFRSRGIRAPAIICTGFPSYEAALRAGSLGTVGLLQKPFRPADLLSAVRHALSAEIRAAADVERSATDVLSVAESAWQQLTRSMAVVPADWPRRLFEQCEYPIGVDQVLRFSCRVLQDRHQPLRVFGLTADLTKIVICAEPGLRWSDIGGLGLQLLQIHEREHLDRLAELTFRFLSSSTMDHRRDMPQWQSILPPGVRRSAPTKALQTQTGRSYLQWRRLRRVQLSCAYLGTTNQRVQQIAVNVGSGNGSQLDHEFKHALGMAPKEFRQLTVHCSLLQDAQ